MSVIDPGFLYTPGAPVGDWHPARYTETLTGTEDFDTDGDKLLAFVEKYWTSDGQPLDLDDWQRWLIRRILEKYPADWPVAHLRGQLRYRQVLVSMGRQNGKSLVAAIFAIYFLVLHVRGPRVLSLASTEKQAKIVYDRVAAGVRNNPALAKVIKPTKTAGISLINATGFYQTMSAKEDALQGEPASGAIYDELHLGKKAIWDALVLAQRAQRNPLLVGITTAGDDSSDLLIRLYTEAEAAIAGNDERFGAFIWEAPDDTLTEAGVIAANPSLACGRNDFEVAWAEAVKAWSDETRDAEGLTGRQRVIRYTLNRFIAGAAASWTSSPAWSAGARDDLDHAGADVVYSVERTDSWEHASIRATSKHDTGFRTELVATFNDASHDLLLEACRILGRRGRCAFAVDAKTLSPLHAALKDLGFEAWKLGESEMIAAAQNAHGIITRHAVTHPDDPLVRIQMARARRRPLPEGWRLSRALSNGDIDTVIGLVIGLYVAAVRSENTLQLG